MMRRLMTWLFGVYLFIYVWSVPMLMFDLVPTWGTWMGGFLLILQGSLLALWLIAQAGGRGALTVICIAVLACAVEYIGVTTGLPFGRYTYTDTLGLKVGGAVPLPIPFAWLMVVPAALGAAALLGVRGRWLLLVAPTLALLLDLLLEPVAAYITRYWDWIDSGPYYGVPTANFVAWGATALVLTAITLALTGRRLRRALFLPAMPAWIYLLNLLQFTLVDLAYGYAVAALIGSVALLGCVWRLRTELPIWWRAARAVPLDLRRSYLDIKPE